LSRCLLTQDDFDRNRGAGKFYQVFSTKNEHAVKGRQTCRAEVLWLLLRMMRGSGED
jgi:hypothetical protein